MLLRILAILIIILALPLWCIDRLSLRHIWPRLGRMAFALPNLFAIVCAIFLSINESYDPAGALLKSRLLTLTLCVAIPEVIIALFLIISLFFNKLKRIRLAISYMGWGVGIIIFSIMLFGFTFGYKQLHIKHYDYQSQLIPKQFNGFKIVQVSDLHLGTLSGKVDVVKNIVDSINSCNADLVVFTGDLVNYQAEEMFEFEPLLRNIRAKHGVISIMGNHDYMMYHRWKSQRERLDNIKTLQLHERALGWKLLLNESEIIREGNDSIAIVGVENDGKPPFPSRGNLPKAMNGLPNGIFKILLSHDPTHWRRKVIPDTDISLTLSGHTHGMQFKVGKFSPAVWFYPEWGGPYHEKGQTLYVSLGVGEVLLPFRYGAWPEINVITLNGSSNLQTSRQTKNHN